jgi:MYXO-CTERM domain-containing protein
MPAPDAGVVGDGGVVASANAISSFTTGTGPDSTPPALSGQIDYSADRQSCGASACCGPFDGYSVGMSWTAATDDGGPVFYELSVEGMVVRYPIQDGQLQVAGSAVRGAILCSGQKWITTFGSFGFEDFQSKQGNYQIVAVDLAGNRSSPLSVNVTVDCSVVDGGAEPVDVAVDTLPPPADASELKGDGRLLDGARDGLLTIADVSPGSIDLYSTPDLSIVGDATPGRGDSVVRFSPETGALSADGSARPDVVAAGDINTAPPDTGPQKQDAAAPSPDAASPSPDAAPVVASKHEGGCSCRIAGRSDGSAGFALVALGLVLAIRRRFRRG